MKQRKVPQAFYRNALLILLGVTRFLSRADYNVPTKWYSFINSLAASSGMLHERIAFMDEEVEREFLEKEDMLERRMGRKKFYSEEEIEELRERIQEIQL